MRLTIDQRFAAPLDVVVQAYTDPALYAGFPEHGTVGRPELIGRRELGDRVELEIRHRFTGNLSSAVRAVLDPTRLTWVEHVTLDLLTARATFRIQPDHYPDRLRCEGEYRFVADGDGCRRTGGGELRVKAPLVAGAVERAIISGLQDHLRDEVGVVEAFVRPT